MGHKLNSQIESKSIIIFPSSKLKGCVHINKDKENPSGKIQRVQNQNPSLNKGGRRGAKKKLKRRYLPSKELV
jgi:hypothetical protein